MGKKTLVFDLDETLVHCNEVFGIKGESILDVDLPTGQKI